MANLMSWQDGELTHSPQISATNRGYLVGQGVFETLLVTNGRAEFLDRHLDRLARSWPRIGTGGDSAIIGDTRGGGGARGQC